VRESLADCRSGQSSPPKDHKSSRGSCRRPARWRRRARIAPHVERQGRRAMRPSRSIAQTCPAGCTPGSSRSTHGISTIKPRSSQLQRGARRVALPTSCSNKGSFCGVAARCQATFSRRDILWSLAICERTPTGELTTAHLRRARRNRVDAAPRCRRTDVRLWERGMPRRRAPS
jgi:hypothetical protein